MQSQLLGHFCIFFVYLISYESNEGGDTNDDGNDSDDSGGESNDGTDGHKYDDVDDGGCLDSVKNCFKYKLVDLESFSLPGSTR